MTAEGGAGAFGRVLFRATADDRPVIALTGIDRTNQTIDYEYYHGDITDKSDTNFETGAGYKIDGGGNYAFRHTQPYGGWWHELSVSPDMQSATLQNGRYDDNAWLSDAVTLRGEVEAVYSHDSGVSDGEAMAETAEVPKLKFFGPGGHKIKRYVDTNLHDGDVVVYSAHSGNSGVRESGDGKGSGENQAAGTNEAWASGNVVGFHTGDHGGGIISVDAAVAKMKTGWTALLQDVASYRSKCGIAQSSGIVLPCVDIDHMNFYEGAFKQYLGRTPEEQTTNCTILNSKFATYLEELEVNETLVLETPRNQTLMASPYLTFGAGGASRLGALFGDQAPAPAAVGRASSSGKRSRAASSGRSAPAAKAPRASKSAKSPLKLATPTAALARLKAEITRQMIDDFVTDILLSEMDALHSDNPLKLYTKNDITKATAIKNGLFPDKNIAKTWFGKVRTEWWDRTHAHAKDWCDANTKPDWTAQMITALTLDVARYDNLRFRGAFARAAHRAPPPGAQSAFTDTCVQQLPCR